MPAPIIHHLDPCGPNCVAQGVEYKHEIDGREHDRCPDPSAEAATMTAIEYIDLAWRISGKVLALSPDEHEILGADGDDWLTVERDGGYIIDDAVYPSLAVMHARLTPENIASKSALLRALLDSVIVQLPGEPVQSPFRYVVRGDQSAHARTHDALLDALLAPEAR